MPPHPVPPRLLRMVVVVVLVEVEQMVVVGEVVEC